MCIVTKCILLENPTQIVGKSVILCAEKAVPLHRISKSALKSKKKEEGYRTQDKRQNTIVSEVISL